MRKCIVCGEEYEYCNSCKAHAKFPTWMALYHDDNCRSIMKICTEYMAGNLTKGEAKAALDKCNLTNKKRFGESVLMAVEDIYSAKKSTKTDAVKHTDDIVEADKEI